MSAQAIQLALTVASGVVLARLLRPTDFGIVGMAATLTSFATVVRDFGMPQATVQRNDLSSRDVTSLFWLSLRLNAVLALALLALSPLVARFYGEARIVEVVAVVAAAGLIGGLGSQHEALLIRQMRFVALRTADLSSIAAGMLGGVLLALSGAGYRALMLQIFIIAVVRTVVLWSLCRWRPGGWRTTKSDALASLASFGWYHTVAKVLRYFSQNADQIVVGYLFGARQLGYYDSAYRWSITTSQQIYTPLQNVAVSGLSRLQNDKWAFRNAVRHGLLPVFTAIISVLVLLALQARPVVLLLLGDQWEPSVPLFRLLCIAAIGNSMAKAVNWLYLAEGRTKQQMRWGFVSLPVFIIAVVVGSNWGPVGVAAGFAAANLLLVVPEVIYCLRTSLVSWRDYASTAIRPLVAAMVSAAIVLLIHGVPTETSFLKLLVTSSEYFLLFVLTWLVIPGGGKAARQLMTLVRSTYRSN